MEGIVFLSKIKINVNINVVFCSEQEVPSKSDLPDLVQCTMTSEYSYNPNLFIKQSYDSYTIYLLKISFNF